LKDTELPGALTEMAKAASSRGAVNDCGLADVPTNDVPTNEDALGNEGLAVHRRQSQQHGWRDGELGLVEAVVPEFN
jgi:hypothetical protein